MKRRTFILPLALALVAALALSLSFATADEGPKVKPEGRPFVTRVAELLGIEVHRVETAITQANRELHMGQYHKGERSLTGAPDDIKGSKAFRNRHTIGYKHGSKPPLPPLDIITRKLRQAVADGKLTEEQAREKLETLHARLPRKLGAKSPDNIAEQLREAVANGRLTEEQAREKLEHINSGSKVKD